MSGVLTRLARRAGISILLWLPIAHAPASADQADRYRLDLSVGLQVDRYQSRLADSLGFSHSKATRADLAFDFRVLDAPMPGSAKPALHVFGHASTMKRLFGVPGVVPAGEPALVEAPLLEFGTGVALHIPMDIVDRGAGSALFVSYEGGIVTAARSDYDFMRIKRLAFGFQRTRGFFEGSIVELGYGRNETYGTAFAARRWTPHFRIQGRLVPDRRPAEATGPGAKAAPPRPEIESLAHAFVELTVDTDNRSGPDGIQTLFGLTLDSGAIFRRIMGVKE